MNLRSTGIRAALTSAMLLGLAPIFGKQAILLGLSPLAVVAMRTLLAAVLLILVLAVFGRQFFYIYPAGLLGCLLAGGINGLGSLLYYAALGRLDAGLGQMLYALYPSFVALWLLLDRQRPNRLTILRLALSIPAVYLLSQAGAGKIDLVGMGMMLAASALYALHLPVNARVLYDMPAPTVTLYTLIAMSLVVVPAYSIWGQASGAGFALPTVPDQAWLAVAALTLVTFLSRLTLFLGVKHLGGMQTAMLGLSELLITVVFGHLWLGEQLSPLQWAGGLLLAISLGMVFLEKAQPLRLGPGGWLSRLHGTRLPAGFPWQPHD